jgi:hypothetical protein
MEVENIKWLSRDAKEAEVTVTDKHYKLVCFAHPFDLSIGDKINNPLYAFDSCCIQKSVYGEFKVEKLSQEFAYKITGNCIDKNHHIVQIGKINIQLDTPLPNDIQKNEFVSFICNRIDLI